MSKHVANNTGDLQEADNQFLHPWDDMKRVGCNRRTVITRGEGVYVYDSDGNRLLDGPGGMWCVNVGHGRREIGEAMAEQSSQLAFCSPWGLTNAPAAMLAKCLGDLAPGDLNHVFFTTGGSSAVDSALRFALFYHTLRGQPDRVHIISREDAYHGSTFLAASVSGKPRDKNFCYLEKGFVHHLSSPNPYRRPEGTSVEAFCDERVDELEAKILELGPDRVAAFIAEPILASGGVVVPPTGYQRRCMEVCRRHGVLYISDEVVTAFGRLGHFFASDAVFDMVPDIITCAKGLTSGYVPLGAVLVSDALIEALGATPEEAGVFSNGFTYSGHAVACAAALENIDIIKREGILDHVREVAPYFQQRLHELADIPIVGDVRGMGLMGCIECVISRDCRDPLSLDYAIGNRIDAHCQRLGLIVRPLINMCVVSPPLIITREQIDELFDILRQGITLSMHDVQREGLWDG